MVVHDHLRVTETEYRRGTRRSGKGRRVTRAWEWRWGSRQGTGAHGRAENKQNRRRKGGVGKGGDGSEDAGGRVGEGDKGERRLWAEHQLGSSGGYVVCGVRLGHTVDLGIEHERRKKATEGPRGTVTQSRGGTGGWQRTGDQGLILGLELLRQFAEALERGETALKLPQWAWASASLRLDAHSAAGRGTSVRLSRHRPLLRGEGAVAVCGRLGGSKGIVAERHSCR